MAELTGPENEPRRRELVSSIPGMAEKAEVTWSDLLELKLIFDVGFKQLDMVKGEIIPQERCYKNEDVVRYLSNLLDKLLSTYTEKEQLPSFDAWPTVRHYR